MDAPLVYLNGDFLPLSEARVSVLDRGFIFGDGVYEVIPVYGGHLFRAEQHLQRLEQSLAAIRMPPPLSVSEWQGIFRRLLEGREGDSGIYLQVTRGADDKRDLKIPRHLQPTVFAMASPLPQVSAERLNAGVGVITLDDIRWSLCNIKATTLLANVLCKDSALEAGAHDAILIREGMAIEGTASNFFIVKEGRIITPPTGPMLLPGVTRDLVLAIAARHGLAHAEAEIPLAELQTADEIWITSSTIEIMPVTRLNDQQVADGRPGPVWRQVNKLYLDCKNRLRQGLIDC